MAVTSVKSLESSSVSCQGRSVARCCQGSHSLVVQCKVLPMGCWENGAGRLSTLREPCGKGQTAVWRPCLEDWEEPRASCKTMNHESGLFFFLNMLSQAYPKPWPCLSLGESRQGLNLAPLLPWRLQAGTPAACCQLCPQPLPSDSRKQRTRETFHFVPVTGH